MDLGTIRRILMRLEDTVIFLMIERAQFSHNPVIYESTNTFAELEKDRESSFMGWMLRQTEITHAKVRRYESPDEYPFTPRSDLPAAILPPLDYPKFLHPNKININDELKEIYIKNIVPVLTKRDGRPLDDSNYGSSATRDVEILQAVSRRIHYGKFVAELKFRDHPSDFITHIRDKNSEELAKLITIAKVEEALLQRLEKKALAYGQDVDESSQLNDLQKGKCKLDAAFVVSMYRDYVIPLTRKVEVEYLLNRLEGISGTDINGLLKINKENQK
ncbi:chorismate mutase [Phakopsora pachyrhizi]|uniref:Chorismate mutase n=1 Tax=Phakopsora pachyrhizi TaxID=170000 RepID=A0AAV0BKR1_PHAPC|nr:chorismate mutase [Phakopsora pachyrhizi]CAH7687907.1 chorismate mutase [Phakopsora pachyrhizi]